MPKPSHRAKLLEEGLRVVHEQGYAGASVRDIVQAAGVPQGSFTNHFVSKEAFGLEVIDLYFTRFRELMRTTLLNDDLPPMKRLEAYLDFGKERLSQNDMRNGCLIGNFTAEASRASDPIRFKLIEAFAEVRSALAYCLRAAVTAGELPADFDCEDVAAFIIASQQGANLLAKVQQTLEPIERFKRILFGKILRKGD